MKKTITIISIFTILLIYFFPIKTYAETLNSIEANTDKQTIHPNETVKISIDFGQSLGAYTVDIAYDNNLLEYVSAEGGTPNDNGKRVRVYFYDETGGSNPRSSMSVTFKAKTGITTSNPTDLSVTAEGLANSDASVTYDDITTPITKNIVVEPIYTDYDIELNYTGEVKENVEKDMKLIISSSMGKNYEHTRIIAKATTPEGATVNLFATDGELLEHDIIQNGWGDANGDPIGGVDVKKELDVRGLFSKSGEYSITLSLIDRDNSDSEIASKTFKINVTKQTETPTNPEDTEENNPEQTPENTEENNEDKTTENEKNNQENIILNEQTTQNNEEPNKLPKTGNTIYVVLLSIFSVIALLIFSYKYLKNK